MGPKSNLILYMFARKPTRHITLNTTFIVKQGGDSIMLWDVEDRYLKTD